MNFYQKMGILPLKKARKSRQMQFHDETACVWGLRYLWDPSLSMNPVRRFAHFKPPWLKPCHNQKLKKFFPTGTGLVAAGFYNFVLTDMFCKPSFSSASHPLQRSRILWNMYASMNVLSCSSMYIYKPPFHIFLSRCCISMNCVFKMLNLSCSLNIVIDPPVDAVQSTWTTIYVSVIKLHLPHQEWNALG